MGYVDALWIRIINTYSKWPPIARTQSLSLCGHLSITLCNTSTGKSAAACRRDCFKLSILGCVFLQHPLPWTDWSYQQDSDPADKAQTTQQRLEKNVPDFVSTSDWPSASLDLNRLDYKLWSKLQEMACKKTHPNIESSNRSLWKAAADFPIDG